MADREEGKPSADPGLVAGKYRLTRLLGRGGMGAVWEAVHETLGTRVAVKLIEAEHVQSPDSRRRFENEARAAAKLQSKHVVEIYDNGVGPDGRPYIVMQYLKGEPLDRRLERVGRLTPADTVRVVQQVCRALSKAHSIGIVHRDLKPENIFLVWDEEDRADIVKVVDFGIAKFADDPSVESATRTGSVLGTPFYMSPEQARGLRSVDHRSDFWSVAVIAFRCMVGELPFQGEAVGDVLVNLCTGPIPKPSELAPDLPRGFDAWIARALSRDPSARFSTATELADSLASACGVTVRIAYSTDDIPIGVSGEGATIPAPAPAPVLMPTYPNGSGEPLIARARISRPDVDTLVVPTGLTGSHTGEPTFNTPSPAPRRSAASIVFATALVTVLVGAGIVALVQAFGVSKPEPSHVAPASLPQALPTAAAPSSEPKGATLDAVTAPSASVEKPAASTPSVDAGSPRTGMRSSDGVRRTPPPRPSATPGLDIRLER